ncbi:MAG: NUDIX hydrolase [Eubacteriales bacterium]|nr:NUDIX hydrolase [Eubacteriales bacterium]
MTKKSKEANCQFEESAIGRESEQKWDDCQEGAYQKNAMERCEDPGLRYAADKEAAMEQEPQKDTNDEGLAWEEIRTEHIVQDEWIDFRRSAYRFPDGSVFEPYYSYSRKDYVVIVASDTAGKYLCVRQYRQGIGKVTTEFPAGCIEEKDGKKHSTSKKTLAKDALEAAKRELKEETGYESDEWEELLTIPSNATLADNYAHLFVAKNCRRASGQELDETEFLNVKKLTPAQIEEWIAEGKFQQAVHIAAWLLALRK